MVQPLVLKKDGHPDTKITLRKKKVRVWSVIGTIVILVPVFWLLGYPDAVTYELEAPVER
jgi:hypothetical protein